MSITLNEVILVQSIGVCKVRKDNFKYRRSGNFRCYNIFVNIRAYENLTHEYLRICLDCLSALVHSEEPLPQQPSKCAGTRGSRGHTTLVRKSPS